MLGERDNRPAGWTLAWLATMSPHGDVREEARAQLRSRQLYEYVPALLSNMAMPLEVGVASNVVGRTVASHYTLERQGPNGRIDQRTFARYRQIQGPRNRRVATGSLVAQSSRFVPELRRTIPGRVVQLRWRMDP